jgi:hypothetical protein
MKPLLSAAGLLAAKAAANEASFHGFSVVMASDFMFWGIAGTD